MRALMGLIRVRRAQGREDKGDIGQLRELRSDITGIPDADEAESLLSGDAGG
jgi:hypothetical protein